MANKDSIVKIYNDLYTLTFQNSTHRYKINDTYLPGVTTILGKVLAKEALMLWPLNTAIAYIRDNCQQAEGAYFVNDDDLANAATEHRKKSQEGARVGTLVHEIIERILRGEEVNYGEYADSEPEACRAIEAFDRWYLEKTPETIAVEQVVYSPSLGYAGTFDSILRIRGKTYLCDLKTPNASRSAPNGVYAENFIQLGAYLYAYNEQRAYEIANSDLADETQHLPEIEGLMVISAKKDGNLDVITNEDVEISLDECESLWIEVFDIYNSLTKVKNKLEQGFTR